MTQTFDWVTPSTLWAADGSDAKEAGFFRPRVLEFKTDAFMEDYLAAAGSGKQQALAGLLAKPQGGQAGSAGQVMKLFQPNHGCFYLVCASLCCRIPGLPDRVIRTGDGERASFVLRKLIDGAEYGWVVQGTAKTWKPLDGTANRVLEGEERLPLFPAPARCRRTLLAGYLPVASRETYAALPKEIATSDVEDPRLEELGSRFSGPLEFVEKPPVANEAPPAAVSLELSVYLLLELWEYLDRNLPDVAAALRDNPNATFTEPKATAKAALMSYFKGQTLSGSLMLAGALGKVASKRSDLNQPGGADLGGLGFGSGYDLKGHSIPKDQLYERVRDALPDRTGPDLELPKLEARAGSLYAARCVYERPQCDPPQFIVSRRTDPFQLAPFWDPDAPGRPVKIPLPTDVSVAGMRKFKPNVTFLMSDAMREKANSILGKEKTLLGDDPEVNGPDGLGIAFICSFSIQIIFIVAFFLLLMFVIILNFVFWWIAFFKICLPVPKKLLPE